MWLTARRKVLYLTRAQLAERIGCSVSALRKIEADEWRPSIQIAELLAKALQIPSEQQPLFIRIARGELNNARLNLPPQLAAHPLKPPPPISNLPVPATPLVGRAHEIHEVSRLIGDPACRMLTLVGPGGSLRLLRMECISFHSLRLARRTLLPRPLPT